MDKNSSIWIGHIKESIDAIEDDTRGFSFEIFKANRTIQDAVIRRFQIIGEASNNLDAEFQRTHPVVDWREIISMRNVLVHEYFGVDLEIVWDAIQNDLPRLKELLNKIKSEHE